MTSDYFDYNSFAYFVLNQSFVGKGTRGFTGYSDKKGNACFIWDGRTDRDGNKIPRKFRFSRKERVMRIPLEQQDRDGQSVVEFLENNPACDGSPNWDGRSAPVYKRLNEEKDAEIAIDAKAMRIKAENHALALKSEEAIDLATLFGTFTDKFKIALHALLENAGNDPSNYLETVEDGAVQAKIVLRRALQKGLFTKRGGMIKWDQEVIGADDNAAVQRLIKDEDLFKSVEINLEKE